MDWEVLAHGYGLAEAPTIDGDGSLVFSDVLGGGVYRIDARGAVTTVVPKRRGVGGIAIHADGGIVCSGRDVVHVGADGETRTVLHVEGVAGWNDLCTDASGRVYAGALRFAVFDPEAEVVPGELWRVAAGDEPEILFGDVVHANGVAATPDGSTIYMSDTRRQRIIVFDVERGARRELDMSAHGHPDGMALDEHGAVWVALVAGGIARLTPDGAVDRKLEPPS
jgi:gluconolactonase